MTRDEIIRMAREAGFDKGLNRFCPFRKLIERFAVLIAEAEREDCAKRAQEFLTRRRSSLGRAINDAILARGQE
jgi:hypothetical protein